MAATHHKFLVHPTTNEVFSWRVVETKTNQIICSTGTFGLAIDKAQRLYVEVVTGLPREVPEEACRCGYQDNRYVLPCGAPAAVTDIETGCTFCATHFRDVIL